MGFSFTFGNVTAAQGSWLDTDFNEAGLLGTLPCTVSGTNALTMTPATNVPAPLPVLQPQVRFSGIATATNTGAVNAAVGATAALNVYKDTPTGPAALTGGEIVNGNLFILTYDAALNSPNGGYHLETATAASAGTVTSVGTGAGLTGGPITGTGSIALAAIGSGTLMANISGGSAVPSGATLSAILDTLMSSSPGAVMSRGGSLWGAASESTYTPALSFGGASTGITYTVQVGQQFAIGFFQIAMFNLVLSAKGSATGPAAISLPGPSGTGNRVGGGIVSNYANLDSGVTTLPFAQIGAGGTTAALVKAGTGTVAALTDTAFTATSSLSGILFYLTA